MFTIKKYEPGETIHEVKLSDKTVAVKAPVGKPSWVIFYNDQPFYTKTILSGKSQLEIYSQKATALAQADFLNRHGLPIGKGD